MPTLLDNLLTRTADEMRKPGATMRRAIATAHTAAYYAGLKERTGVLPKGLSKVERAELKKAVAEQLQYYDKFVDAAGEMSEAGVAARAQMYVGAIRGTFLESRWGAWDIPSNLMPGNQTCLSNCRCDISVSDNGDGTGTLTRTLGASERNCEECAELAGEHEIQRRGL